MIQIDIFYSNNTLNVSIEGIINKNNINQIKRRLYYIISEYGINDIVIDIKNTINVDKEVLSKFLDDYDINYGGNLVIIDK
ncbi:MAG: hypothetical protein RR847_00825 [Bacilli bacterium]